MESDLSGCSKERKKTDSGGVDGSRVRAMPFVRSQKPCGAEVGDMTRCENNNTPWQSSTLCQHRPEAEGWRAAAAPVTPTATMGEHQPPNTTLNFPSDISALFEFIPSRWLTVLWEGWECLLKADGNAERRLVLKIWMIALRPPNYIYFVLSLCLQVAKVTWAPHEATNSQHILPWLCTQSRCSGGFWLSGNFSNLLFIRAE